MQLSIKTMHPRVFMASVGISIDKIFLKVIWEGH